MEPGRTRNPLSHGIRAGMGPAVMHLGVKVGSDIPRQLPEDLVFPPLPFAFGPIFDVFRGDGTSKGNGD